jgi:hypothetical protein
MNAQNPVIVICEQISSTFALAPPETQELLELLGAQIVAMLR